MAPPLLPIYELEDGLVEALRRHPRAVVSAPTGSGKSTQVPQMLLAHGLAGDGQVVSLQPRRLAARMLARRVAAERNTDVGGEVGYQVRFDHKVSDATRIRFVTEGLLLRQWMVDPMLSGVSAILLDEFHERHLYGDLLLARALQLQRERRPDLLLVVMSATLDVDPLRRYLDPCAVLAGEGRTYPVTASYLDRPVALGPGREDHVWDVAAEALDDALPGHDGGDVLVFLPGVYEIERTVGAIRAGRAGSGHTVLPLHGSLSSADQDAAVGPAARPKVVVATNVAETSVTIDGVTLVIDSGLARVAAHDPHRGINTLRVEKISRASAEQRAGRAGRTRPGRCVRLWTEQEHAQRPLHDVPEVCRLDLSEALLTLRATGVEDVASFPWFEPPDPHLLAGAESLLQDLGAVDRAGRLTPVGRDMAALPAHPRYARMLTAARAMGCVRPVALAAALTQGRDLLERRSNRDVREAREDLLGEEAASDFFPLMRAWQYAAAHRFSVGRCRRLGIRADAARQVGPVFEHLLRLTGETDAGADGAPDDDALCKCLLLGFSDQVAVRLDQGSLRCALVHGRTGTLARESAVRGSPLVVAADVREVQHGSGRSDVLLNLATAVEEAWLRDLFPGEFGETREHVYDPSRKRVVVEQCRRFRDLVLERTVSQEVDPEEAAALLAGLVVKGELPLPAWDRSVDQWIARVNFLAAACPELDLPPFDEDARRTILQQACLGAVSRKDVKGLQVARHVRSWLSGVQAGWVEKHAPERVGLPSGRKAKLRYDDDPTLAPALAATIQDLYGVKASPRVAMGRTPVRVEILGPNRRPVQVTDDLPSFWTNTYPAVKQELQRRYPKHEWR